jgi:maltose O-acetyltransferase
MTEREKMLSGTLYDPMDPELVALRRRARQLSRAYGASEDAKVLYELFGSLGPGAVIDPPFYCDYGAHITAGARLYLNFGCTILDVAPVTIGDDLMVGPHAQILTATHPIDATERCSGRELGRPVRIGSRVWIGAGAIVCPGVTIGDDTTIGAGAVVTRDVPPRVLAAGNPARVIRTL